MKRILLKDHQEEYRLFNSRMIALMILIIILCGFLVIRLVNMQLYNHSLYKTLSNKNQLTLVPIEPNRGLIYDRNGILLAENTPTFNLEVVPEKAKNIFNTIAELQKLIPISDNDIKSFYKQLKQQRRFQAATLRMKLTEEEVAKFSINQFKFPGVSIKARLMRHYIFGPSLAHALGYVSRINQQELQQVDPNNYAASGFIGKVGLEKFYETQLHGTVGYQQIENDASGRMVRIFKHIPPVSGDDLYLTIDIKLQRVAEKVMAGEKGALVAIDPNNGEILAFVSTPSFDPNLFVGGIDNKTYQALQNDPDKPLFNRAIRAQYPIGSTIKPFMAAIGLDSNTIDENYRIFDPGSFSLPNSSHVYRDWILHGHGVVNVVRAITVSCDVFFYGLGIKLGIGKIHKMLSDFGFGQRTQVDMLEESSGVAPSPEWKKRTQGQPWYPGDTVNASIGQGFVLGTILQLANATATMANSGIHYQPHLLHHRQTEKGQVIVYIPKTLHRIPYRDETWELVHEGMHNVIASPEGTAAARFGQDTPYTVAGKSGTVQVVRKVSDEDIQHRVAKRFRNHSFFIVYAPIEKPQIAIAIVAENNPFGLPKTAARKLLDFYFLKKEPTDEPTDTTIDISAH